MSARGERTNKHSVVERMALHANAVPENGTPGKRRGRIDCHHSDTQFERAVQRDECVYHRRFTSPRIAGDTDDVAAAGVSVELLEIRDRLRTTVVDVAHQPRSDADVSAEDTVDASSHGAFLKRCSGPAGT